MIRIARNAAALAICTFAVGASAQEPVPASPVAPAVEAPAMPANTITVNPLSLAFGSINFEYERATSPRFSWFAGPRYSSYSTDVLDEEISSSYYGVVGGVRFFLTGHAPEGFFLSPNVSLGFSSATVVDEDLSAFGYTAGVIGGYTWIFGGVFDLSLGLGAQYVNTELSAESTDTTVGFSGVLPDARLSLGVAF